MRRPFARAKSIGSTSPHRPFLNSDAVLRQVLPQSTDYRLSNWLEPHVAAAPLQPTFPHRLWIFLSGSFAIPQRQMAIIRFLADHGCWAINLRYPNTWTIKELSQLNDNPHIHELLRLQIIDGQRRTDLLPMPEADCIVNRLEKVLIWLHRSYPADGWGSFLAESGELLWSNIAFAGHSQGGGHAALIGKLHCLQRVVTLASPVDSINNGQFPAPWLESPSQTPCDRYFGFSHAKDPGITAILTAWQMLDLARLGPVAILEDIADEIPTTHRLLTNCGVAENNYHACLSSDRFYPTEEGGRPIFERVWRYLFDIQKQLL